MHLLQYKDFNILLDCGLERDKKTVLKDDEFPFDPEVIDAVILSHNHSDHCGKLPALAKKAFVGRFIARLLARIYWALFLKILSTSRKKKPSIATKQKTIPHLPKTIPSRFWIVVYL